MLDDYNIMMTNFEWAPRSSVLLDGTSEVFASAGRGKGEIGRVKFI